MKDRSDNLIKKAAQFIVDKRNAFYLVFVIAVIYCVSSISRVSVNNDITSYLPNDTETRIGIEIMDEEFITYGSANIMVSNITYEKGEEIADYIEEIEGISSVVFDDTEDHYVNASAFITVMFKEVGEDHLSVNAMKEINDYLQDYDTYVNSVVGVDQSERLKQEMSIILLIAVVVIIAVLTFTSKSYMEILVFVIVFSVSAILNMGTNFWFGEVSFITNAVAVVLQLALAIDYAIILCHRFMEEKEKLETRDAAIESLSKAILEISASSLTTISGLLALTLMQFRIGYDMGTVLIKGIFCSLVTVFLLMPGLLMLFSKAIDKTRHKNFVPSIRLWGIAIMKLRYILPGIFLFVLIAGYVFSGKCNYAFSLNSIDTTNPSEERVAMDKIRETFGEKNTIALLVPSGDYAKERTILDSALALEEIDSALGIANTEITAGEANKTYVLAQDMTSRQFAEMSGIEIELSRLLYNIYGISKSEYGAIINRDDYAIPLIDIFIFLCEQKENGVITIDDEEMNKEIDDAYEMLQMADKQLRGENWSRIIFSSNLPEEGEGSFELIETIRAIAAKEYGEQVIIVGETVNAKDLSSSFQGDNVKISVLTILFVMTVLVFTFKSSGLPVLLIMTIQGSIWINFSFPYLMGKNMFFIAYLIVSSIQMGATIDYAIVVTNRYMDLKTTMDKKSAAIEALNQSFATVLTSGTIMTAAGFLIYYITTDPTIGSIGLALGRGTLISIILVMTLLPQLLVIGDSIIERTKFTLKKDLSQTISKDTIKVDGRVKGYVSGYVDAEIRGTIKGDIHAVIESSNDISVETEVILDEE